MAIEGSLEVVVTTNEGMMSNAQRVRVASLASIPAVLANNFGVSDADEIDPVTVGTVTSAGSWTGTKNGAPCEARLWEDIPFEETAIGRALAAGTIDPLNPGGAQEG